ncbi:hypothetical protein Q4485_01620 [Granulosicoccaceae sp. 1_MG-2023]|nr:hypothetical protein [Granulosicoccaceae sp. 1_MG-2023]
MRYLTSLLLWIGLTAFAVSGAVASAPDAGGDSGITFESSYSPDIEPLPLSDEPPALPVQMPAALSPQLQSACVLLTGAADVPARQHHRPPVRAPPAF